MIIKVTKYNAMASGHQYNISKKNKELIVSNMYSSDANGIKKEFEDLHLLNKRCNENYQFVLSLAQGESFNNLKWKNYVQEILEEFGLNEHIYYAVKHNDTDNQHLHLVVSGVSRDGKPSPKMRGFYKLRASELALEISKRDQHQQPIKLSKTTEKGAKQERYSLDRIIRQEIQVGSIVGLKLKEMNLDLKKSRSNKEWESIITDRTILSKLNKYAKETNEKTILSKKLADVKSSYGVNQQMSGAKLDEWIKFCQDHGLYAREIKKDGSVVYGMDINGRMRYFNEIQLAGKFDKQTLIGKSKTFLLDRVIKQQVLYATSWKDLNNMLERNNITMNLRINGTGLYGVVFLDKRTGQTKSLSSLGLKIGTIKQLLNKQEAKNIDKLASQRTSLTIPAKIIIFAPANSKFINQQVNTQSNIHSSINANVAKVLDREQYENHQDDLFDRRKKTL